jgi:putative aminopeptidase FrvX
VGKIINMHVYLFREGAGDCSSCVGVMLELSRGVSQWAHGFKSGVLFLFNTGEEEGLDGARSFITQVGVFEV